MNTLNKTLVNFSYQFYNSKVDEYSDTSFVDSLNFGDFLDDIKNLAKGAICDIYLVFKYNNKTYLVQDDDVNQTLQILQNKI